MSQLVHWSVPLLRRAKMCYNTEYKVFSILCEYMRRRRQRGVKRDERASDLDLIDLSVGF